MSHFEHFAKPFSKGKNYAVIKDIAKQIEAQFGVKSVKDFDSWTVSGDPPLHPVSYGENESEATLIGSRLFNALFEKNRSVGSLGADARRLKSFNKWLESEEQCRQTNIRFRTLASGSFPERGTLVFLVSRKIASILGECPRLSTLPFGFGPGANVGVSRLTSVRRKISAKPTVTANAAGYVSTLQASHPFWDLANASLEKGRLTFVPKSAAIDRAIVVEPVINTYVQKGIGTVIRRRLKAFGVDLDSQETNRAFARFGSLTNLISTLDLSNASDTISKEVVAELLPYDWYRLLSDFRTPSITYEDRIIDLQKFSSMGNGFTFELESLIFFAIISVVCNNSRFLNVFGDDLIVPTRYVDAVIDALTFFGFSINQEKSFTSGVFRESCGKDFWKGVDIRPCYVKDRLSYKELFRYHNFCKRNGYDGLANFILRFLPKQLRSVTGPDGYGDGHLIGDWLPIYRDRKAGWGLLGFRTFQTRPLEKRDELCGDYAAFLFGTTGTILSNSLFSAYRSKAPLGEFLSSDPPETSRSMYQERGGSRYILRKVYTWAR